MNRQSYSWLPVVNHDGTEAIYEPRYNSAGQIIGVLSYTRDITERERADEALHESKNTLESALANMSDAVFISDAEGNFLNFNDAFVTYHRFKDRADCSKSIFTCSTLLDVWFTETGEIAKPEMWAVPRALRGESAKNFEYTLKRRDTGETWIGSYNFAPIRNNDGVIVGSVVTARDITERKQAEELLAYQANLLANISDVVYSTDNQLRLVSWNQAAEKVYGWKKEEVLGKNVIEVTGSMFNPEMRAERLSRSRERGSLDWRTYPHTKGWHENHGSHALGTRSKI